MSKPKAKNELDQLMREMEEVVGQMRAGSGDDPGLSTWEWAEHWRINERAARIRLQKLHRAGLIVSGRRHSTGMDGRACMTPVYRVK